MTSTPIQSFSVNPDQAKPLLSLDAKALDTFAKAVVERLPNQILAITVNHQGKPPTQIKLDATAVQQLVKTLTQTTTQSQGINTEELAIARITDQAGVFQLVVKQPITQTQTINLTATAFKQLTQHLMRHMGELTLRGESSIAGKLTTLNSQNAQLTLPPVANVTPEVQFNLPPARRPIGLATGETLQVEFNSQPQKSTLNLRLPNRSSSPILATETVAHNHSLTNEKTQKNTASVIGQQLQYQGIKTPTSVLPDNLLPSGIRQLASAQRPENIELKLSGTHLQVSYPATKAAVIPPSKVVSATGVAQLPEVKSTTAITPELLKTVEHVADNSTITGQAETPQAHATQEWQQLRPQIQNLAKQLLAQTGSTNSALITLQQALASASKTVNPTTQALVEQITTSIHGTTKPSPPVPSVGQNTAQPPTSAAQQTPAANPTFATKEKGQAHKDTESNTAAPTSSEATATPAPGQIKDVISHTMMANHALLSPTVMTQTSPPSSMVEGLMSVLKLSLAAKLGTTQAAFTEQATRMLIASLPASPNRGPVNSALGTLHELAQLDKKHNVVSAVKSLLANHSLSRLAQADSKTQGSEAMYLILPIAPEQEAPVELMIEKEHDKRDNRESTGKTGVWKLNMKLTVGTLGEMLAKSSLQQDKIEVHLYTSSDALLDKLKQSFHLFEARIAEVGLKLTQSSVQRGKIPATLAQTPYQIFETQA